ncbi:NMT1/THI5 like protein [Vibrio alginolyticus]|uniref:NMT1/THI5 like protein n=3 Tax=Vibrionaceae TaxID=641 RepID=A0A1W6US56_VIBAL|nr:ABC transporter substrate-binding protein [Vibrio alginolyticus]ARP00829.1 NMT1/THI5 like protein [Vibrio alginolyticus]ARP05529.1 NMT1/THI5 like protein [Vibrio alginolyticus]ARP10587.1 NMT1/THI5 like protein [Vibrio alginolyticus]ARP15686.1 NMT1/THI5 like protein [Vibrio alginolyticus]ARP20740.1 NMT1/THI5 like protein [Vibrio alginolyticus]
MDTKQISTVIIILVLSALVVAYLKLTTVSNAIHKPTTIGISKTPLSAPFIIAEHIGAFEENDLNVELIMCFGGVECSNLLLENHVNYATFSESVLMFKSFEYKDLALITSFASSTNDIKLLTKKRSGIESIDKLPGKKVGVIKNSASEYYLDLLLQVNDIDLEKVEKISSTTQVIINHLMQGNVDAISTWEPYGFMAKNRINEEVKNIGIIGVYKLYFLLVSKEIHIEKSDQEVMKIIKSLHHSINWMDKNPHLTMKILSQKLNITVEEISWSWDDYNFRLNLTNSLLFTLQSEANWALKQNYVEGQIPNYRKIFKENYINSYFDGLD